jgi:hypothetical protein
VKLADFGFAKVVMKRKTVNGMWGHRDIERLRFCWGMNMIRKWMRGVLHGVVMYIMLARSPPFNGKTIERDLSRNFEKGFEDS